jgi:polyisoprenoid-binding protein YceI
MSIEKIAHGTAGIALPPGRYRLHPELTSVTFSARKFGLFTVRGTMGLASGAFTVADPLEQSTLNVVLAADSFSTPMANRDKHVKGSSLLDTAQYPTIEFHSTGISPAPEGWEVRGLLTAHGQVAPAALSVSAVVWEGGLAHVSATARVNRRDFGVTAMRAAASAEIEVRIDAVGTPVG